MTDPLRDWVIDEDAAIRAFVLDHYGPPAPGSPTGEEFWPS
jgi:hypothetical protein